MGDQDKGNAAQDLGLEPGTGPWPFQGTYRDQAGVHHAPRSGQDPGPRNQGSPEMVKDMIQGHGQDTPSQNLGPVRDLGRTRPVGWGSVEPRAPDVPGPENIAQGGPAGGHPLVGKSHNSEVVGQVSETGQVVDEAQESQARRLAQIVQGIQGFFRGALGPRPVPSDLVPGRHRVGYPEGPRRLMRPLTGRLHR